jgi:glycerol-3-phosphate acyltransferase PlsY
LGDLLKGLLPVALTQMLDFRDSLIAATALAAFLGHVYPIYYGFKGGKGVATALGVLLGMHPLAGICAFITWLVVAFSFRFSSLAALSAALLSPAYMLWFTGFSWLTGATIFMSAIVLWRHRSNFRQLLDGTEDTIGSGTLR